MTADPIQAFTAAITAATIPACDAFADDAVLDATVPNWRFTVRGADAIRHQLSHWYADPGRFEELRRTELAGGALVEFVLTWEEDGEPYAAHQLHHLTVAGGRIVRDTVFCGGRWDAAMVAEMAQAERATATEAAHA
jgi:ketosteroid isomerase-like protein